MFNNSGKKIMSIAKVFCIIKIVLCVLIGYILIVIGEVLFGILLAIIGTIISWISAMFLYAFGQLVDNSDNLIFLAQTTKNIILSDEFKTLTSHTGTEQETFANDSQHK